MNTSDLLREAFGRIHPLVVEAVEGLDADALAWRPDDEANSVGWLVWHLLRVQDDHVAEVADIEQAYTSKGWARRFDLPLSDTAIGYGHSASEVASVRATSELLIGYGADVAEATSAYLGRLTDVDLDRVVDERWDPPVTLAVRLVSVLDDDLEHVGQAAYVRGLLERR